MFDPVNDPQGFGLAQRARERRQQRNMELDAADDERSLLASGQSGPQVALGAMQSKFERARSDAAAEGYNSDWGKFFEALQEQKEDAEAQGMKYRVGLRGIGNPAMASLQPDQQPMPESHDAWLGRTKRVIYGPSMDSLNRGR